MNTSSVSALSGIASLNSRVLNLLVASTTGFDSILAAAASSQINGVRLD